MQKRISDGLTFRASETRRAAVVEPLGQGRTIEETIEIARDVAKKLIEAQTEEAACVRLPPAREAFDYPLIINT